MSLTKQQQEEVVKRLEIEGKFLSKFKELITRKMEIDPRTKNVKTKPVIKQYKDSKPVYATDINGNVITNPIFSEYCYFLEEEQCRCHRMSFVLSRCKTLHQNPILIGVRVFPKLTNNSMQNTVSQKMKYPSWNQ